MLYNEFRMKNIFKRILLAAIFLAAVLVFSAGCKSKPAVAETDGIRDIFAGVANVFILKSDSTLWAAGYNRYDQLGMINADKSYSAGVIRITEISDDAGVPFAGAKSVAAGEKHTVILKDDGTIWGAGDSSNGELGQKGLLKVFTPLKAADAPISGAKAIAAGNNTSFFIDSDGSLWASGYNYYGELGFGNRNIQPSFSKAESAGQNIKAIASGLRHTVILKEDGTLWAAGYNFNGQLGFGDTVDRYSFTEVKDAGSGITAIAAGNYHTVILKGDGSVWTTGSNYWGQLGFADNADRLSFTRLPSVSDVRDIAARGSITVLLKTDNSMLLAGNYEGPEGANEPDYDAVVGDMLSSQSRRDDSKSSLAPLLPEQGTSTPFGEVKKITLGLNSIYVIDSNGLLWAAGSNRYGQLSFDLDTGTASSLKLVSF